MQKKRFLVLTCGLFLLAAAAGQEAPKEKKVLKNADVVLMAENHFDDETLLRIIDVADTDFDISGDELIRMKNAGVSSAVLRAMLQATQRKKHAAEGVAGQASPAPGSDVSKSGASGSSPAGSTQEVAAPAPGAPTATDSSAAANASAPSVNGRSPARAVSPAPPNSMASGRGMNAGGMGSMVNPQQMAAMQSQLGSIGGIMGMMNGMMSMNSYAPEQMPHVFLRGEINKPMMEVSPSTAQMAQTKFNGGGPSVGASMLRSIATQALSFAALGAGPGGMMAMSAFSMGSGILMRPHTPSMTYVWGLPGRKSNRELNTTSPLFELSYGEIPGVDPDGYEPAIVKLVPTRDNYRLVGATKTKMGMNMMNGGGVEQGKWFSEERWPVELSKEERGFYVLKVLQALEPGEYAVVLRPVKGYKQTTSGFGGGAQVFYSVWDFSVPGAPDEPTDKKKKKR
jgi:hypothetical protein